MCSGPTVQQPAPRSSRPRKDADGERLVGGNLQDQDDINFENQNRGVTPGSEQVVASPNTPLPTGNGTPISPHRGVLGGLTTIGQFSLNYTRPTGITALKPGFPRIGR